MLSGTWLHQTTLSSSTWSTHVVRRALLLAVIVRLKGRRLSADGGVRQGLLLMALIRSLVAACILVRSILIRVLRMLRGRRRWRLLLLLRRLVNVGVHILHLIWR